MINKATAKDNNYLCNFEYIRYNLYYTATLTPDEPGKAITKKRLLTGAIVGIVIACVVVAGILVFILIYCLKNDDFIKTFQD